MIIMGTSCNDIFLNWYKFRNSKRLVWNICLIYFSSSSDVFQYIPSVSCLHICTVNSMIGHAPKIDTTKEIKYSEVKFLELMRFTDRSTNTMRLYLDNILYDEVGKHILELNQHLVSVPKSIIQHPKMSLLKFNEANFHI